MRRRWDASSFVGVFKGGGGLFWPGEGWRPGKRTGIEKEAPLGTGC